MRLIPAVVMRYEVGDTLTLWTRNLSEPTTFTVSDKTRDHLVLVNGEDTYRYNGQALVRV